MRGYPILGGPYGSCARLILLGYKMFQRFDKPVPNCSANGPIQVCKKPYRPLQEIGVKMTSTPLQERWR